MYLDKQTSFTQKNSYRTDLAIQLCSEIFGDVTNLEKVEVFVKKFRLESNWKYETTPIFNLCPLTMLYWYLDNIFRIIEPIIKFIYAEEPYENMN